MPPSPKMYKSTVRGVSEWANSELAHVGRIASVEDPDLQYSYALSTVNGMLHLRNAVYELYKDPKFVNNKPEMYRLYYSVNRALQHLIKEYNVNKKTIDNFNTRRVLGDISDLNWDNKKKFLNGGKTRKSRRSVSRTRKNMRKQ